MRALTCRGAVLSLGSILASVFFGEAAIGQPPSIEPLVSLDEIDPESTAFGVSANGAFIVGEMNVPGGEKHAFRWTATDGMVDLGTIANFAGNSAAFGVSGDGSVVVGGSATRDSIQHAFRWTAAGGMKDLGTLGPASGRSVARSISSSGKVIVGDSDNSAGDTTAFRFAGNTMSGITLAGIGSSSASAVSADGSVVIGSATTTDPTPRGFAFRLTSAGGFQDLGAAPGDVFSSGRGVTPDGSVIVGFTAATRNVFITEPMIWTAADGMRSLSTDNGGDALFDISADGKVAVGATDAADSSAEALVWIDDELISLEDLLIDAGVDVSDWSALEKAFAISDDGRVVVGSGKFIPLNCRLGFRVLLANRPPAVEAPQPVIVECDGGRTSVTLAAQVADPDSPTLTVQWRVDGVLRKSESVPAGTAASFTFAFPDGESEVAVSVSDGELTASDGTTVTVSDTTNPVVIVAPNVQLRVDQGKIFASRSRLPLPSVTDVCDEDPTVVNNAPLKLPVGLRTVRWTATDADGNAASVTQKVKVVNDPPKAKAGRDIRLRTSSRTAKARLDGSASFDKNGHRLKFVWSARGIPFVNGDRSKATGTFPIGTTIVKLTVTDPLGAKSTDTVRVIVRRVSAQSSAELAEHETVRAFELTHRSATGSNRDAAARTGYDAAATAYAYGRMALATEDPLKRLELRLAQSAFSKAAGDELLRKYLDDGDDEALEAATRSYHGAAYGLMDLGE